ncbi:MAG: VWA domain-containing protein [Alphaproteobacteria bacterium]|nr:VWA domain-containing protein [Alphaproteobacteria bacterium]
MRTAFKGLMASLLLSLPMIASAQETAQDRASVLILDASGSMWSQLDDGTSRIEVARDVLSDFLAARDPAQPLGVIAYGHNRKGDCTDIEVLAPVGRQDPAGLGARLRTLNPRGKTPLADALQLAATQIPATSEEADIVLVTDGLETCGGNVCAVAAGLAAMGIPVRAHVVGFGLTETEMAQIACVADTTGGLMLSTQSGAELADALIRTTAPVVVDDLPADQATLNLTIRADSAGRPDRVQFSAENLATGAMSALGTLDFTQAAALPVDLIASDYRIIADAGEMGHGEIAVPVAAGDNRTVYVPFQGLLPTLDMPAPTGTFRAGVNALLPYRVRQEGLATGGGDFILSLLPLDATTTTDRRYDYASQDSTLGGHVGAFRAPQEPGDYLLTFSRNADLPIDAVMKTFVVTFVERPDVTLTAPPAVEPGADIPVTIAGGMGSDDWLEIRLNDQRLSWDNTVTLAEFFDNRYGPAKPLLAPTQPGEYELVYIFGGLDDAHQVAARLPLTVGTVPDFDEQARATDIGADSDTAAPTPQMTEAARCDDDTGCGMGEDAPHPGSGVVQVVIAADGAQGQPIDWTLNPIGRAGETPVASGAAIAGPWTTALDEGIWGVNGLADGATYFGQITVSASGPVSFAIPRDMPIEVEPPLSEDIGFTCDDAVQCSFEDPEAQIIGVLPAGWVTDVPTREAYVTGGDRGLVRMSFFNPDAPENAVILNPRQWLETNGPCLEVQPGLLCRFEPASAETLAAFDMLKLLLRDTAPRNLPSPAEAMATIISDLAKEDPNAARAMEALMGAAAAGGNGAMPDMGDMLGALATGGTASPTESPTASPTASPYVPGEVLRRCPLKAACPFEQPNVQIAGVLPPSWSVEVMARRPDGTVSTWFTDKDPAGNAKRIGLNQSGGDSCVATRVGTLCAFTPYIATDEIGLIASTLVQGSAADVRNAIADKVDAPKPITNPAALDALLSQLEGN